MDFRATCLAKSIRVLHYSSHVPKSRRKKQTTTGPCANQIPVRTGGKGKTEYDAGVPHFPRARKWGTIIDPR